MVDGFGTAVMDAWFVWFAYVWVGHLLARLVDVFVGVVMGGAFAFAPGLCMGEEVWLIGGLMGWLMD